jgi:hypothetical protein
MFPRGFAIPVPAAGIKTCNGETAASCMIDDAEFRGTDSQMLFRHRRLGDPGQRLHPGGVFIPDPPPNLSFGIHTPSQNSTTAECVRIDPDLTTPSYEKLRFSQEAQYHRSKSKLGAVPDGVAQIPPDLLRAGFGIGTRTGESAGSIIQNTRSSLPDDPTVRTGYQVNRMYNWKNSGINPLTHTFGIRCNGKPNQVAEALKTDTVTHIVPTAVDRADHNSIVPEPDPVNPRPRILERTMISTQLRPKFDPSQLPPAGVGSKPGEFTIGDTFAGMGLMTSFDSDYEPVPRQYHREDTLSHGIPTKPNPFPNPLSGPGKYSALGLTDEDFLVLRDRAHVIPVMVKALALSEDEAAAIFDDCARNLGRETISIAEFHAEFKQLTE